MRSKPDSLHQRSWFSAGPITKRTWLFWLAIIGLVTATLTFGATRTWLASTTPQPAAGPPAATPPPTPSPPLTVALLGYGGGNHEGGQLTDTMMVAHVDRVRQVVTLISVPRDTWVDLPIAGEQLSGWKINAAYALGADDQGYPSKPERFRGEHGGGNLAKFALAQVLGFPIDHYVSVSFAGFTRAIDVLGGIDVTVERTFDDYKYPIAGEEDNTCGKSDAEIAAITATLSADLAAEQFACRYEHLRFTAGVVRMDGATALKYARSRHSAQDGGDFNRAARQRQVIQAVKNAVLKANFGPKAIPFIRELGRDIATDLDLATLTQLATLAPEWQNYELKSLALTTDNVLVNDRNQQGQFILRPVDGAGEWSMIHLWLQTQLQAASQSSSASSSATATTPAATASARPSPASSAQL